MFIVRHLQVRVELNTHLPIIQSFCCYERMIAVFLFRAAGIPSYARHVLAAFAPVCVAEWLR